MGSNSLFLMLAQLGFHIFFGLDLFTGVLVVDPWLACTLSTF